MATPPVGSTCSAGGLGEHCETDDACVGLPCVAIFDSPGILEIGSCSMCARDADCPGGQVCDLDVPLDELGGVWTCVPVGSEPLGSPCAFEGAGDAACASGHCVETAVDQVVSIGVCSECAEPEHCDPPQVCDRPKASFDGSISPGSCA